MMKITGLAHLFKWENLHNWWLTKYFFAPLYVWQLISSYTSRLFWSKKALNLAKLATLRASLLLTSLSV